MDLTKADRQVPKRNERRTAAFATILMLFEPSMSFATPKSGAYVAESNTAMSITGNIELTAGHVSMARGTVLPLDFVETVSRFKTDQGNESVRIFRVTRPMNPVLLNKNRLCTAAVRWIVVWQMPDRGLGLAAFSGAKPHSEDSPGLCGTFFYGAAAS